MLGLVTQDGALGQNTREAPQKISAVEKLNQLYLEQSAAFRLFLTLLRLNVTKPTQTRFFLVKQTLPNNNGDVVPF